MDRNACCPDPNDEKCRTYATSRREFLKALGAGAISLPVIAGPFAAAAADVPARILSPDHFVPWDKRLKPAWIDALYARGGRHVYRDDDRAAIGMPVGGIGAGQIYVGADGTLREWNIMNRHVFSGFGKENYEFRIPERVADQGFAVAVKDASGKYQVRRLREEDFPEFEFIGEYPIAEVAYPADSQNGFPIQTSLRAFSPFIPLNADDSTLPATFFQITLRNTGAQAADVSLISWLENISALQSGDIFKGARKNSIEQTDFGTWVECRIEPRVVDDPAAVQPPHVFADFEGEKYGEGWKSEGDAFGDGPVKGTWPGGQQTVKGFEGERLVNSFRGSDDVKGRLTSPTFKIERDFINFLVGGGSTKGKTCINLIVDEKVVASKFGKDTEELVWASFDAAKHRGKEARIQIVDEATGGWGHINVDQIVFADEPRIGPAGTLKDQEDFGTFGMIFFEKASGGIAEFKAEPPLAALIREDGTLDESATAEANKIAPELREFSGDRPRAIVSHSVQLKPGEEREFVAALVWNFPNHSKGRAYTNRFATARDVAAYLAEQRSRLIGETLHYHQTYYNSTLPHWLLDRIHATVANLATDTTQYWKNGRFWAWEGVGCCEGTCTHVWNYEHALARLFPSLERSTRLMQDLGAGYHDGLVGFRSDKNYAADGQLGTVLKCYREHLISPDDEFLKTNWAQIRKVMEFSIGHDENDDGLIEDRQHNTYDIDFYGPNPFVGSLYLAALRAAEEMARRAGDAEFAGRCHRLFENGSERGVERLFNGEYFRQIVDLEKHPKHQYAEGCLTDQLFGQGWAHQVGLGYIYPKETVLKALDSIYGYNWAPDVGPQTARHVPDRYFARRGDAGLFICTWPKTRHLGDESVLYRDEVWTGCEYQVAGHMIWEGKVQEGLTLIRAIHERYDGRVHNPFNEVECGDHYARALASWGALIALSGFYYDGPAGVIGFDPKITPEDFRSFFSAAEGWGTISQARLGTMQTNSIKVEWGTLRLTEVRLRRGDLIKSGRPTVTIGEANYEIDLEEPGELVAIKFAEPLVLKTGETLSVAFG